MVHKYNPDKSKGNKEMFQKINNAYKEISKRK